jgi:hypothetical protein
LVFAGKGQPVAGLVGGPNSSGKFEARIVFRTATNIFDVHICGMPSGEKAKHGVRALGKG